MVAANFLQMKTCCSHETPLKKNEARVSMHASLLIGFRISTLNSMKIDGPRALPSLATNLVALGVELALVVPSQLHFGPLVHAG